MELLKLYMMLLGCKPAGRNTEQHDVLFGVGRQLKDLVASINEFWPDVNNRIHLDAWREVTQVGEYDIAVINKKNDWLQSAPDVAKLFFVNLGGYKTGDFEEYHYKLIVAAKDKAGAIQQATKTAFYKHCGFKGAPSHVDDTYGIDVDDLYEIGEILPPAIKNKYAISLTPAITHKPDELHLGYMKLDRL